MRLQKLTLTLLLLLLGWRNFAQTNETHSFTNLNWAVPDGNYAGLSDVHVVNSAIANITSLRVKLKVSGEFNGDLYGYLRHAAAGATNFCVLLNRTGRTAVNRSGYDDSGFDITLDDAALSTNIHCYRVITNLPAGTPLVGSWRPDGRKVDPASALDSSAETTTLGSFAGTGASGDWTLFLADVEAGGTNLLVGWELEFSGHTEPLVTPSPNLSLINQGNGSYLIQFDGVPGKTYRIQFTESVGPAAWELLGSATVDPFGSFQLLDTPPVGTPFRFYRSIYP